MPEQGTPASGSEAQTQTPPEVQEAQQAMDEAQTAVVDEKERIRDLEAKLTKEGRSRAQIKAQMDDATRRLMALESELEAAKKVNEKWNEWYLKNAANPQEKEAAARQRMTREQLEAQNARNEAAMLRAILAEDDPVVKQVLTSLADEKKYLSKDEVAALKRGLGTKSKEEPDQEEEEAPPAVKPKRTTGGNQPTLDQQIKEAKEKKDSVTLLNLLAQKQNLERQV